MPSELRSEGEEGVKSGPQRRREWEGAQKEIEDQKRSVKQEQKELGGS